MCTHDGFKGYVPCTRDGLNVEVTSSRGRFCDHVICTGRPLTHVASVHVIGSAMAVTHVASVHIIGSGMAGNANTICVGRLQNIVQNIEYLERQE